MSKKPEKEATVTTVRYPVRVTRDTILALKYLKLDLGALSSLESLAGELLAEAIERKRAEIASKKPNRK